MTNVDGCEINLEVAVKINQKSVKYFANACNVVDAVLFYISTDYVFAGEARIPYKVTSNPSQKVFTGRQNLPRPKYFVLDKGR